MNELLAFLKRTRKSQTEIAGVLEVTQQTISERKKKPIYRIPEADRANLVAEYPEYESLLRDITAGTEQAGFDDRRLLQALGSATGSRPTAPAFEDDALPGVHSYRTASLAAQLARRAAAHGLASSVPKFGEGHAQRTFRDALLLEKMTEKAKPNTPIQGLLEPQAPCDLASGTVVVSGSSFMHPPNAVVLDHLLPARVDANLTVEVQTPPTPRFFYFGYETQITLLCVKNQRTEKHFKRGRRLPLPYLPAEMVF